MESISFRGKVYSLRTESEEHDNRLDWFRYYIPKELITCSICGLRLAHANELIISQDEFDNNGFVNEEYDYQAVIIDGVCIALLCGEPDCNNDYMLSPILVRW